MTGWPTPTPTREWEDAAFATQNWLRLSPAELQQLSDEVVEVLTRWGNRELPDDGRAPRAGARLRAGLPEPAVSVDTTDPDVAPPIAGNGNFRLLWFGEGVSRARLDDHRGGRPAASR